MEPSLAFLALSAVPCVFESQHEEQKQNTNFRSDVNEICGEEQRREAAFSCLQGLTDTEACRETSLDRHSFAAFLLRSCCHFVCPLTTYLRDPTAGQPAPLVREPTGFSGSRGRIIGADRVSRNVHAAAFGSIIFAHSATYPLAYLGNESS